MVFKKKKQDSAPPLIARERRKELQAFERQAAICFKSTSLLNLAFAHRSYSNESGCSIGNNEKLEFLGDSVLGVMISEYLYTNLQHNSEGEMAKIKSVVVSEATLASIAKNIHVDNYLLIGKGEEHSGGRSKKAILADCMEAIIGAYYLDSGFKAVKKFVGRLFGPEIETVRYNKHQRDFKTLLQELAQKKFKTYPKYKLIQKRGPDHDRTFWINVQINERCFGPGIGKNKKEAEQKAAGMAFESLAGPER